MPDEEPRRLSDAQRSEWAWEMIQTYNLELLERLVLVHLAHRADARTLIAPYGKDDRGRPRTITWPQLADDIGGADEDWLRRHIVPVLSGVGLLDTASSHGRRGKRFQVCIPDDWVPKSQRKKLKKRLVSGRAQKPTTGRKTTGKRTITKDGKYTIIEERKRMVTYDEYGDAVDITLK